MKKKEFQNLPSKEIPINADNLNEMQSNIEESCVAVSPTQPTTNEKVWIDDVNKTIKAKDENGEFKTVYDKSEGNLIAETILTENSSVMEVSGLNIDPSKGEVYEIVIAEYSTSNSALGHALVINDITNGYRCNHFTCSTDELTFKNKESFNDKLCYVNGWNMGTSLFFTKGILTTLNLNWINFQATGHCIDSENTESHIMQTFSGNNGNNIGVINSLKVMSLGEDQIGAGSYIKVYKK